MNEPMYYAFQQRDGTIDFYAEPLVKNPVFENVLRDLGKRVGDPLTREEVVALTKLRGEYK